jgi:nucleotidyltransferase substrate binding protein (TIGR01987 family)
MKDDSRWQQRFAHFEKAFLLLQDAISVEKPSILERAGLIQFFERAFDIGCKMLREFEEAKGLVITSPRHAIRQAAQARVITDGEGWLQALADRDRTGQSYQEEVALDIERKVRFKYFPLLQELRNNLGAELTAV